MLGITNWKNPNQAAVVRPTTAIRSLDIRPLQTDTAKASIASPMPSMTAVTGSMVRHGLDVLNLGP